MVLKQENLESLGFQRNGSHESVENLFYKRLLRGLEIEVDLTTGEGVLSFFNVEKDLTPVELYMRFENEEQIKTVIETITRVEFHNHGYK
ncbi:MAG TPA: hypothetical protein VF648_00670 [Pyrinomonadaceae bacterium]|jgi:hypothetical protein